MASGIRQLIILRRPQCETPNCRVCSTWLAARAQIFTALTIALRSCSLLIMMSGHYFWRRSEEVKKRSQSWLKQTLHLWCLSSCVIYVQIGKIIFVMSTGNICLLTHSTSFQDFQDHTLWFHFHTSACLTDTHRVSIIAATLRFSKREHSNVSALLLVDTKTAMCTLAMLLTCVH